MIDKIIIKALIGLSTSCEQKITHKCSSNILTGYSSWIGIDGATNNYWHGNQASTRVARTVISFFVSISKNYGDSDVGDSKLVTNYACW